MQSVPLMKEWVWNRQESTWCSIISGIWSGMQLPERMRKRATTKDRWALMFRPIWWSLFTDCFLEKEAMRRPCAQPWIMVRTRTVLLEPLLPCMEWCMAATFLKKSGRSRLATSLLRSALILSWCMGRFRRRWRSWPSGLLFFMRKHRRNSDLPDGAVMWKIFMQSRISGIFTGKWMWYALNFRA